MSNEDPALHEVELWAGAECTVNRVGDGYRDQILATGHHDRIEDLDLVAELGAVALRFPLLWERVAPEASGDCDWRWSDERLERLRRLAIRPIAGLLHHGSGPRHTSLLDERFAEGLAAFAGRAAERYRWVTDWTPVNEPLTTARFSALYGHWYPHVRDERSFWLALLNQVEGTRAAMRAIRRTVPQARLVQTEDLGRTYATAPLATQAGYENVRRWLTWDLLFGKVTRDHPLWPSLCGFGFEDRLRRLADDPCPPDVIGINHYLTSERFLDHRVQRYPLHTIGGNGRQAYADIEAVRVLQPPTRGLRGLVEEAWARYRAPIAITEIHNGCTREEQVRWVQEAWRTAADLRRRGVEVVAVTAWAIFGSQGWNTLLTDDGLYEPGAFDLRGGKPRPTALARTWKSVATPSLEHTPAAPEGWWSRDIRLLHPVVSRAAPLREHLGPAQARDGEARPILITGATGTLGQALAAACRHRNLAHVLTSRRQLDLADPAAIDRALDSGHYFAAINAAGWVRVDDAESEREACLEANARGAAALARGCAERGIPTVSFSSDLVLGGTGQGPYTETDPPRPLNVYGESKLLMEEQVAALPGDHLIVRTAAFFSQHDEYNFAKALVRAGRQGQPFLASDSAVVSPTYVPDLCNAVLDLLLDGESGLWHLTSGEALSWHAFALRLAAACGIDPGLVRAAAPEELGWRARRPRDCSLASERGALLPSLESAIGRFAAGLDPPPHGVEARRPEAACADCR
jgi:dTDP-4-dehydrorhamnose reductase